MRRFVRKHQLILLAIAVYNAAVFYPVVFMGRVLSPNDIFFNFEPWSFYKPATITHAQNALLHDAPTSYLTLMTLLRDHWAAFHWNPFIGSGIPGFGSSASAVLSPFILLPVLLIPLTWVYTGIVFLKLNAPLVFTYLWLREERLGRGGATAGAAVTAGAGIYSVRWLWQITNATALYPAFLWILVRAFNGRHARVALTSVLVLAYLLSGFPAAIAYGAYIVAIYAVFLAIRTRTIPLRQLGGGIVAMAIGAAVAMPSLVPFVQFLRRSGYLAMREGVSGDTSFPLSHLESFIDPDRLGNPGYRSWIGDAALGGLDNYVEATIFLGIVPLILVLFAPFARRARSKWFWLVAGAVIVGTMFGLPLFRTLLSDLPGFKFSTLTRIGFLLPLAAGYLGGAGLKSLLTYLRKYGTIRRALAMLVVAAIAFELGLFAGRFHPYLEPRDAAVPSTPTIRFLQADAQPFRIAPFFNYLWPNSSEMFRLEDVRSHFGSEADYRRMLQRIDPGSWGGTSTVLQFNSLNFAFDDPLVGMLGVRWFVEHKTIDILKWKAFGATVPGVKETGAIELKFDALLQRSVAVDAEPFWAIEVPVTITSARGRSPRVVISLLKQGRTVWSRAFTQADAAVLNKVYVPLRPFARLGETVTLRVQSVGVSGSMLRGAVTQPGDAPIFYGRVMVPVVFDRELPDGRLFRNLAEVPRFRAAARLRKLNGEEFLALRNIDFAEEAVITDDPVMPPEIGSAPATVKLVSYAPAEQRLTVESAQPFFLASSEKLTPELAVTIDGESVRPIEINLMFAGVAVPAGRHDVVFSRVIGRGWWGVAVAGVALWLVIAVTEIVLAFRRRRVTRAAAPPFVSS